jgi:cellulose synthase/poly-beta-1,6-N-acetylglucosamine synthase-like glycosyltransferase
MFACAAACCARPHRDPGDRHPTDMNAPALATVIFWLAAAGVVYTYAGYPLLLILRARFASRPPQRREDVQPGVTIVVVVHNEAARIEQKIQTCLAQSYPAEHLRVLVVSDGSTDATGDIVRRHDPARVRLLALPERRGKAACLNDAVAACGDDILVMTDARQRLHPEAVARLVAVLADPAFGAVSGELMFETEQASSFGGGVDAYWRYEKLIRRHEALLGSVVGVTGALYAIRRSAFKPIPPQTILDDVLIPMQVVMAGQRVGFEPGALAYDIPAREVAQERKRKVRTLAGNFQLLQLCPALLLPGRNPIWGAFLSHKLARLAAPWAMLAALLANAALLGSHPFYAATLALQLGIYALALAGLHEGLARRLRLARIAHAFVVLNVFAMLGLWEFLSNRQAHLWTVNTISGANAPGPRA